MRLIARFVFLSSLLASQVSFASIYSDEVLRMLEVHERDISASLSSVLKFSNQHQVDVVGALLDNTTGNGEPYQIANKAQTLLTLDNEHAARAITIMVEDGRRIMESLDSMVRIQNEWQAEAVHLLVEGRTYQGETYGVANKMDMILAITNETQLQALRFLVEGGVGVMPSLSLIPQVTTQQQLDEIAQFATARTISKSIAYVFKNLRDDQINLVHLLLDHEVDADVFERVIAKISVMKTEYPIELLHKVVNRNYDLNLNAENLLAVSKPAQISLADFVMARHLPLSAVFNRILEVTTDEQVQALKAELLRRPLILIVSIALKKFGVTHPVFKAKTFAGICAKALSAAVRKSI